MKNFRVVWEIDIDAETPEAAAHEALEIQRDPDSVATCFYVTDSTTKIMTKVDFYDLEIAGESDG